MSDPLTRLLAKDVLKEDVLYIQVSAVFEVNNFANTLAMTLNFFFRMFQILCRF